MSNPELTGTLFCLVDRKWHCQNPGWSTEGRATDNVAHYSKIYHVSRRRQTVSDHYLCTTFPVTECSKVDSSGVK